MTIRLYDLAGAEDSRRMSPFCWRVRLALAHKQLPVETVPWRMVEKEAIAASGQGKVPVIEDAGRMLSDSWAIIRYLEQAYPDRPSLFRGGPASEPAYGLVRHWVDAELLTAASRLVIPDFFRHLHPKDQPFFRETREPMFGMTIEAMEEGAAARIDAFRAKLGPLRRQLAEGPFVEGDAPGLSDYLVFSIFMWARSVGDVALVAADDSVRGWIERMLDAHGGLARSAPGYEMAA